MSNVNWQREPHRSLKSARSCHRHLAGELGVRVHHALFDGRSSLTPAGRAWLEKLGIDASKRARTCMDWSERRPHLAGPLGTALLDCFLARRWLVRVGESRVLRMTKAGQRALARMR